MTKNKAQMMSEVAEYKPIPASSCYRHLNLDFNWQFGALSDYMTEADAVEYAEFCADINLDATYLLLVPHQGYTIYKSKYAPSFPSMKTNFAKELIEELHKRNIAAIGYISLARNWFYDKTHHETTWYWEKSNEILNCLNSDYMDYVLALTEEAVTELKIDAIRYDTLMSPRDCKCEGCKKFYRELYGEELPDDWNGNWKRAYDFQRESSSRAAKLIYETVKKHKPELEVWQNGFMQQIEFDENNLEAGRYQDVAYIECGDPFRQLFQTGVLDLNGTIVGGILKSPKRSLCYALGGSCYSSFPVSRKTLLPEDREWYKKDLKPFYETAEKMLPFIKDTSPVPYFGIIYCERTRYRNHLYDRSQYVNHMRHITESYLEESNTVKFFSNLDIGVKPNLLERIELLYLPQTSGLSKEQTDELLSYVNNGGIIILSGGALGYDEKGNKFMFDNVKRIIESTPFETVRNETCAVNVFKYGEGKILHTAENLSLEDAKYLIDSHLQTKPITSKYQVILNQDNQNPKLYYLNILNEKAQTVIIDKKHFGNIKVSPAFPENEKFNVIQTEKGTEIYVGDGEEHRILAIETEE